MKKLLAVLVVVVAAAVCGVRAADQAVTPSSKVRRVGIEEYEQLRTKTNTVLLDVRSAAEFEKGHIPGAINMDINSTQFTEKVSGLDKGKTYLVNCAVGMRSARACQKLTTLGFTNLVDLAPGFEGWKKAEKPVQK
jgi:rhodanese-related sulfurtransferase